MEISKKGISYKKEGNIIFFENMNLKNNEEIKLTIEYQITNTKLFNLIHKESLGLPPNDKEYEGEIYIYCSNEHELFDDYIKSKICVKCKKSIEEGYKKLLCGCYLCEKCLFEMINPNICPFCPFKTYLQHIKFL